MTEKKLLKKSGICTCVTLLILSIFWFVFSIQTSFGYSGTGTTSDLKTGSRVNGDILAQPINGSVTIYFGTQSTQGTGSMGYIGTNTAGLPKFKYSYVGGSSAIDFIGFGAVYINGVAIPSSGSVSSKIDAVGGTGTNNLFTNLTVDGNSKIQSVGTENSFLIGGNLGLGTTTPDSKLHVEGNAIISGFSEYKGTGTPPIPTAGNSRLSAVTSQGITRIFHLNELGVSVNIGRDNVFIAKNTSGGTISKGQVVYVTGSVGAIPTIAKALANSKSTCSAIIGVIVDDILNNAFGLVMINGILESFDTSAFSTGDSTWVGTSTPGLLTNVRPVHPYYQKGVGVILNSGVGNGSMLVNVAPFLGNVESGTDVPAYTFAGDASVSGNLSVTGSVNFGTTTPSPSKIPISLGTGFLNDSWLSSVISKLGQTIEIGTETTGNTDNISEGNTNKYYTDARVNTVIGSSSITSPQVSPRITFTSPANGQFLKIVDVQGNIENGTSSVSADFSAVTGSLTPTQLPDLIRLPGTTTAQIASNDLILYNYATSTSDRNTKSLLACNNAGTSTFVDTSGYGQIVVANGNIIGTSTSKYGSGAALFDGTTDFLTVGTNTDWAFLHKGTSTVEKWIKPDDFATNYLLYNTWDGNGTTVGVAAYITTARNIHLWNHKNGAYCLNVDTGGTYPNDTTNYHHVRVVSDYSLPSNQVIVYVDGISIGTLTVTAAVDTGNPVEALSFGKSIGGEPAFKGLQDSMMVTNTALCSTNFTSPTQEAAVNIFYTQYQTRFQSPVDGNIPFQIITHGTATAYVPVVAFNATHTIFGSSTSIYSPVGQSGGTTTVYTIDASNRNVLGVYYTPSEEILKVVHTPEKVNRIEEMKRLRLGEWSWQIRDVNRLDAEARAKEEFVKVELNEQDYEIITNNNGSITVIIDAPKRALDYDLAKSEKELEWAYTLDQASLIDSKEEEMESGQERYMTPFAGDLTTPAILQDRSRKTLNINSQIGYAYETIKELIVMIGSLTTRVEILENK